MSKPGIVSGTKEQDAGNKEKYEKSQPILIRAPSLNTNPRPLASSAPATIGFSAQNPDDKDDIDDIAILGSSPPGAHPYKKKGFW